MKRGQTKKRGLLRARLASNCFVGGWQRRGSHIGDWNRRGCLVGGRREQGRGDGIYEDTTLTETKMNVPNQTPNLTNLGFGRTQMGLVYFHLFDGQIQKVLDASLFLHEYVAFCPSVPKEVLLILRA